ncbi:MAG: HDOD domain-containing protein [Burkholderiales bacterium]|nr:HDOD domain-containing protein [Burkholderiales bacterium]
MNLAEVVETLGRSPLPVLAATADAIGRLALKEDKVSPRDISRVVLRDPMMTLKVLRWAVARRSARQNADITTVEHTLLMHGVSSFFQDFRLQASIESALAADRDALAGALRTVSRAQHAAAYARAIAQQRHDTESDEVVIGALLHDVPDLLLWLHRPAAQAELARFTDAAPHLDRAGCEGIVHGFSHAELLLALCTRWSLPDLLARLMDDRHATSPRIATIAAAVDLAHLTAAGWHGGAVATRTRAVGEPVA